MTGYDPAALFLLGMQWPNLYEPARADKDDKLTFRCKGCQSIVARSDREKHYRQHRREHDRAETKRQERIRRERIQRLRAVK